MLGQPHRTPQWEVSPRWRGWVCILGACVLQVHVKRRRGYCAWVSKARGWISAGEGHASLEAAQRAAAEMAQSYLRTLPESEPRNQTLVDLDVLLETTP